MSACVFCDIIGGRVSAVAVFEDEHTLCFLDHRPLMPGHVLVVPRAHYVTLADLPSEEIGPLFTTVKRISGAMEVAMKADGTFIAINIKISQSVPHLHVHVVPRRKNDGLFGKTFQWIRRPYPSESAIVETQRAIRAALQEASRAAT